MGVIFHLVCFVLFISTYSPCLGVLRKHCDIIQHEYFDTYSTRMPLDFGGFDKLNFSLAAVCKSYKASVIEDLEEVPEATDWLFLEIFHVSIKPQAFAHLTNLRYIYIVGNFVISPVAFLGLKKLSVLWLQQTSKQIIDELDLRGLSMLQELKLKGFPFSSLNKSIFDNLHQLRRLILDENSIETLSSVTQYLPKLESLEGLSLINNNITAYRETDCLLSERPTGNVSHIHFNISYLNIDEVQRLGIENNSLCNFPKLAFFKPNIGYSDLKSLKKSGIQVVESFSFTNSQFPSFYICIYVSRFRIQELQLANNNIKVIHTTNGSCSILRSLDLSFNAIKTVAASQMKNLKKLKELNLSNNKITTIEICPENVSMALVYLNLDFNYLSSLTEDQFKCLIHLKALSLKNNKILTIENYSFRGMKTLEVLHLDSNSLYYLDDFAFADVYSLKQLSLSENLIWDISFSAFKDLRKLEEIALGFKSFVPMFWSQYMESLKKMSLKTLFVYWELESKYFNLFNSFESLSIDSPTVLIDSCNDFPFYKVKELYLRNTTNLICDNRQSISIPALEKFTNLEKLYLIADISSPSKADILNTTLGHLTKLSFFHLENTNKLEDGSALNLSILFLGLGNLQILHLVNSGIEDYGSNVLFQDLKSVTFLMIAKEQIYRFPDNVFSDMVSLKYVFFPETNFSCKCDVSWLSQWVKYKNQVLFLDFYNQPCLVSPQIQHSDLVPFLEENCNTELGLIAFMATLVSTLIFILISFFYESIWWYILYKLYIIKCWLNNRQIKREYYEYDVFVSYNTHNEQWVTEQLLPNLEQNLEQKVCIHNRDFEIGRDIVENIVDSINSSRWTICVITHSYLQSNWCSLEIKMATYRLLAERKDSLLLIFLDNIPKEELQHYHKLTKILEKKTYLKWTEDEEGQQLFWASLRKVITGQTQDC